MAFIQTPTDLYATFAALTPVGAGGALVTFKVETNTGDDPERAAEFLVYQLPTGGNLDSMVAAAHETLAGTFETLAKILRREAQQYQSRSA